LTYSLLFLHYPTKKKDGQRALCFDKHERQLTALLLTKSVSASGSPVKEAACMVAGGFFMVATTFQKRVPSLPHHQAAQSHRQKVKDLLPNRTVGYSPDLARAVGGATIGLFLSQLLFLSDKGANPEGWIYKSEAEMGRETGLTKREQQTARRKLLALGVIQIVRRGFKFTYHFRIVWERLLQVIEKFQRGQNVPTRQDQPIQNVSTEPIQNVSTEPPECLQNVSTEQAQNVATPDSNRDNNRENKETEKTNQKENQTIWTKTIDQLRETQPLEDVEARLSGTALIEVTETAARIGVNNPSAIAWLERRLYREISSAIKQVIGKDLDLQFVAAT
jgi:hypothetical protein